MLPHLPQPSFPRDWCVDEKRDFLPGERFPDMINELERKLLEVIAPSALAIASIFFAVLAFLFGAILTLPEESKRRPLRIGIGVTYLFSLASLFLSVVAMIALRYQTVRLYEITIWTTGITMMGMFGIATFMLVFVLVKTTPK
jgi:hypothetical protein